MLTALELLDACQACYESPSVTAGPFGRDGASVTDLPDGGTLLVFRGTISAGPAGFLDWLNDLRARLVSRPEYPGRVHEGFADALDNLWPMIYGLEAPLCISGHSLGASLALLAAVRLVRGSAYWREHPPEVVQLAAPMTGDYAFAEGCEGLQVTSYINPADCVPQLPPFLLGYWTVGTPRLPPPDWQAPHGLIANHRLDTGYRPWIERLLQSASSVNESINPFGKV